MIQILFKCKKGSNRNRSSPEINEECTAVYGKRWAQLCHGGKPFYQKEDLRFC